MNDVKQMAVEVMDELHRTIPYDAYCTVMDGLQEIETLQERDEELEEMWGVLRRCPHEPGNRVHRGEVHGMGAGDQPGGDLALV